MSIKSTSWIVKILLVLLWDIYGLIRRLENKSIVIKLLGIIFFIFGGFGIIWLIDLCLTAALRCNGQQLRQVKAELIQGTLNLLHHTFLGTC